MSRGVWPPAVGDVKGDLGLFDDRDDEQLGACLDAAVTFVESVRSDRGPVFGTGPTGADLWLGTVRLAGRWHTRRRSPDMLISMGELGSARVPAFDADIERLLGIGRYRDSVLA